MKYTSVLMAFFKVGSVTKVLYISSSIFDKNTHFLSNILDETCKNEKKIVIFVPNFKDSIMPAPDITFQNEKGKTIHLDKLKGKITLIDFWASWCGPCRKEIPHVKKYYEEYKNKGVQFISVSIDAKKDAWTKALKEEQMPWLQGWAPNSGKEVLNTYQFNGIPFLILLDKKGNIYRKYLRDEKIKQAIEDCLAGK